MIGNQRPENISTKQRRIAELAERMPEEALDTLSHHIDLEWLREAYRRTRKNGAVGVDGQRAAEFAEQLETNLQSLLDRAKSGQYRAPAVRRVNIPKGHGETRPIGIPTFEDKVLQRAVLMVLEPIYEQAFMDCSYGFRPKRSAHQALAAIWQQLMAMGGGWVIEVDIRKCFDTLDHGKIQSIVRQRVRDGVLTRLIGKWLNAGVMDEGVLHYPESGSPQGGVISPLLMNVYMHEVMDRWFEREVRPRLRGHGFLVRYADDMVLGFSNEADAHRVMAVLHQRFGKYGLTLHPKKTRLVRFRSPNRGGDKRPGTFDFLGFTHFWGTTRRKLWAVKRKTARDRFSRALKRVSEWCQSNRHRPVAEQHGALGRKMQGHYGYYGITGNSEALERFVRAVERIWHKWLARRSQRRMTWQRFRRLLERFPLPPPVAVHSVLRFGARP